MNNSISIILVILASFWASMFFIKRKNKELMKNSQAVMDTAMIEAHKQLVELREIKALLKEISESLKANKL